MVNVGALLAVAASDSKKLVDTALSRFFGVFTSLIMRLTYPCIWMLLCNKTAVLPLAPTERAVIRYI